MTEPQPLPPQRSYDDLMDWMRTTQERLDLESPVLEVRWRVQYSWSEHDEFNYGDNHFNKNVSLVFPTKEEAEAYIENLKRNPANSHYSFKVFKQERREMRYMVWI